MSRIWNYLNKKDKSARFKTVAFLWILALICGIIGLAAWGLVQLWALDSITWMLVFIWYPGFAAALVGFFYTCNNEFGNGAKKEEGEYDRIQEDEAFQARNITREIC